MQRYLIERLVLIVPTLFGLTFLVFALVRVIPGGAESAFCAMGCTEEDAGRIRQALGLDGPVPVQYWGWLTGVARGDLGRSLHTQIPVSQEVRRRLPISLELGTLALLISLSVAIPIGALSAVRPDTLFDYFTRGAAVLLLAVPGFWLATVLIAYGGNWFNWAPPLEYRSLTESPGQHLLMLLLPALILAASSCGSLMRLTRAQMLEVLGQDYVRMARAKGLHGRTIVTRHALRNALIPVVTLVGLQIPVLVSGSVILESIFQIPGMGQYLVGAIGLRDFPVIQGVNLLLAIVVVLTNLIVDISYALLDPRVSYRSE